MIPYFEQPSLSLGPFTFYSFGLLVAVGFIVGGWVLHRRAVVQGFSERLVNRLLTWVIGFGLAGAVLLRAVFFGGDGAFFTLPGGLPVGLYSFGGIVSAVAAAVWLAFRDSEARRRPLVFLDLLAYAFPFGWLFGRLGCFTAHDHPGIRTDSWIAVRFPEGACYDLGLLEALATAGICLLFWQLGKQSRRPGFFLGLFLTIYGPLRIGLTQVNTPVEGAAVHPDLIWAIVAGFCGIVLLAWTAVRKPGAAGHPPARV